MDAGGAAADVDGIGGGGGVLETPLLDLERPNILQKIYEQGGYAYVRMSAAAAAGDFRAAEAAREVAWEQLHSGPWHSVLPIWRDAYAMACLNVAKIHYSGEEFKEALRALDLGLIMGGMSLRSDLNAAIETSCARERAVRALEEGADRKNAENEKEQCRIVREEDYDQAEVIRSLPFKSLSCKLISRRSSLSLDEFMKDYFLLGSPVIISDCMAHWPAKSRWNDLEYLKKVAGFRTVPVEVGKNYLCSEWKQELITFSQFLERILTNDCSSGGPTYLAQHPLFDQIQDLRKDICIPDYCFAGGGELRSINSWFGPARTVTPLHHDPHHNILAQVVGKKYIRLYPASIKEDLYPHSESMLCNSSQVDLDDIDFEAFPKVHGLEFLDCILEEGEMLYIPPKWWHYVRSLTISFSVSFWWSDDDLE